MTLNRWLSAATAMLTLGSAVADGYARNDERAVPVIVCPADASPREALAAGEIRRYLYLRTGALLTIERAAALPATAAIVVARKDRPILATADAQLVRAADTLSPQQYLLKTLDRDGHRQLFIVGGDDAGTLFGAYRFIEHLGVRFALHDDIVPDGRMPLEIPLLDAQAAPLFDLRGIQPFHDFPEGPDWWNADDYKAVLAQLPKLRMNFIGLHTYPENAPFAEPTVWIGLAEDVGPDGHVKYSYPAGYQYTFRSGAGWGYFPKPTGKFSCGGSNLFDHDAYGADVMGAPTTWPPDAEGCNAIFNRTGDLLRDAFTFAHALGIQTCVGTETPLTVPQAVKERLAAKGLNPAEPAVRRTLYAGIFTRISRMYPLDYYWFWTPEGWTWDGARAEQVTATFDDIKAAIAAAKSVNAPFKLATCGWVLGPQDDRAAFDRELPRDVAVSCINRRIGIDPVEPGFANVSGRGKWAIPWLEDDGALTSPQLWVGRMRRDAVDARKYGCTGLMGIHWRTRVLGPNVLALARAAWDQTGWRDIARPAASGPLGGKVANYPESPIDSTDDDPVYQSCRYDLRGYRVVVPDGRYKVTLKFCEVAYDRAGVRVFDVSLNGRKIIEKLDIFAKAGKNKALDFTFDDVEAVNARLDIEFGYQVEFPCIAGIVIEGPGFTRKISCGGGAYQDFEADPPEITGHLASGDFYRDWAAAEFGASAAGDIAAIFERLDGLLPRPSDWVNGPGGVTVDPRPWNEVAKEYAFVAQLEALRPKVTGPANLERFDYWLNTFRYMRAIAHARCIWGEHEAVMKLARAEKDPAVQKRIAAEQALPIRKRLIATVVEVYQHLLAHVGNPGELGTLANWDQHVQPILLGNPGEELARFLGESLPSDAELPTNYAGAPRLIVPTRRTSVMAGERLTLKAIVLDDKPAREVIAYWRPLGTGEFQSVPFKPVARGVYAVTLPAEATAADLEYRIQAVAAGGQTLPFPPGAPDVNRTVVILPTP